jgi:hypothetical protein
MFSTVGNSGIVLVLTMISYYVFPWFLTLDTIVFSVIGTYFICLYQYRKAIQHGAGGESGSDGADGMISGDG